MNLNNLKGDLFGGLITALVSLPLALACGILLFKGIDGMQSFGINAAFYTAILASIISAFIGNHALQIGGPLVVTTLILSDFLLKIYEKLKTNIDLVDVNMTLIVFMMVCVIGTGIFQFIFAYFKLGKLIKFLPISVTMGVSTTIGIIIIIKQLPVILNYESENLLKNLILEPISIFGNYEVMLLIFITFLVVFLLFLKDFISNKEEIIKKLKFDPFILLPILSPLLAGTVFFLLNNNTNFLLGNIDVQAPLLSTYWDTFINILPLLKKYLLEILLTSFAIALMASLSSLLSVSLLERKMSCRNHDTSIELSGQALGNLFSGLMGGMPTAGTEARGLINYNAGGRTYLSGIINALVLFLIIFIFNDFLALIPEVILSALLVYTGLVMSLPLLKLGRNICMSCFKKDDVHKCIKDILHTFAIVIVMIVTAFLKDVTVAIVAGFAMASLFFIYEMMKNSTYNIRNGSLHHSRRERPLIAKECLKNNGTLINIIELDGAIFFGTADSLRTTISNIKDKSKWIILDFRKVTEIDITGAEIIRLCLSENKEISFYLSHIRDGDDTYQALCSIGIIGKDGLPWFEYTDTALETVENLLLQEFNISTYLDKNSYELDELLIAKGLNFEQKQYLIKFLEVKEYIKGEYLYKEGSKSEELFLLKKGSVSIFDQEEKSFRKKIIKNRTRRITFSPGVVVGEMAFFENSYYSVEAVADEDVSVYILSRSNFNILLKEHPLLAQELMLQFCKHLSRRLREVTDEVQVLEQWN